MENIEKQKKSPTLFVPEHMVKTPLGKDGKPMLRFESRIHKDETGALKKAIYIGGEHLDWSVDISSLMDARQMGPEIFRQVQEDIQRHYVESVSEFVGRKVTAEEIKEAVKTGWI